MHSIPAAETNGSAKADRLYMALELSQAKWLVVFSVGGEKKRRVAVSGGDCEALMGEIAKAKRHFKLPTDAPVRSCYEAGRDGFWLHRWLVSEGVENAVVDSSSIQVDRRARRVKTDRVDAEMLMVGLVELGTARSKWHEVRVPTVEQEDARELGRELEALKKDRTALSNRIKSLLIKVGVRAAVGPGFLEQLDEFRLIDGSELAPGLKLRLKQEYERWTLVDKQLKELSGRRDEAVKKPATDADRKAAKLAILKGVGATSGHIIANEYLWKEFKNRREVGAAAGLTGTPYDSGSSAREQGISKAGNRRVRVVMVELAWRWLAWQPDSQLSRWFHERFGQSGKRSRRIGIVALARKLLIAFWRFVEQDVVPAGAILKPVPKAA